MLPPLARPPLWAIARVPDSRVIAELQREAFAAYAFAQALRENLTTDVDPVAEHTELPDARLVSQSLKSIVATLRALHCTATLTAWLNAARVLAVRSATEFDSIIMALQRLYAKPKDLFGCDIDRLQQNLEPVLSALEQLLAHFDAYPSQEKAPPSSVQISDIHWQLGRRSGLSEAFQAAKDILRVQGDQLEPEQLREIERALEQQQLHMLMAGGTDHSAQQ
jgi:leucyl aminopeptidase